MKKQKYNVTIREIYPYNFYCDDVWHHGIQIHWYGIGIHWSCEHIGYGVLTIDITKDGKYEFDTENMGLEFTNAVLKAYNSYLLKKAKDYFAIEKLEGENEILIDCVETEQTKEDFETIKNWLEKEKE